MSAHLRFRKINAAQRRCISQGKMVFRNEEGKIHCRKQKHLSRARLAEAKSLVKAATVEDIKAYLSLKGFHSFSHLRKEELINLIFRHTDPESGDVILFRPPKSSPRKKDKASRKRSHAKESSRKRRK